MSQYISFYLRSQSGDLCPLGTFCRSSRIFQEFENIVPFERLKCLSDRVLKDAIKRLNIDKEEAVLSVNKKQNLIDNFIPKCNNTLEEKQEVIFEIENEISEIKEDIADLDFAINYLNSLLVILEDVGSYNDIFDREKYLYCGIEVPDGVVKKGRINND